MYAVHNFNLYCCEKLVCCDEFILFYWLGVVISTKFCWNGCRASPMFHLVHFSICLLTLRPCPFGHFGRWCPNSERTSKFQITWARQRGFQVRRWQLECSFKATFCIPSRGPLKLFWMIGGWSHVYAERRWWSQPIPNEYKHHLSLILRRLQTVFMFSFWQGQNVSCAFIMWAYCCVCSAIKDDDGVTGRWRSSIAQTFSGATGGPGILRVEMVWDSVHTDASASRLDPFLGYHVLHWSWTSTRIFCCSNCRLCATSKQWWFATVQWVPKHTTKSAEKSHNHWCRQIRSTSTSCVLQA